MDDKDKNAVEKLVDKINDVVEGIMTTTADAIDHAMEPKPLKPGDKVFLVPMAGAGADPLMTPAPMMPVAIPKKEPKAAAKQAPAKIPPKKAAAKKASKKSSERTAKKTKSTTVSKKTAKKVAKKQKVKR
jgi:hypothetical protein